MEYEGLHLVCFHYGRYGHKKEGCPLLLHNEEVQNNSNVAPSEVPPLAQTTVTTLAEEASFGLWMLVQRSQRRNPHDNDSDRGEKGGQIRKEGDNQTMQKEAAINELNDDGSNMGMDQGENQGNKGKKKLIEEANLKVAGSKPTESGHSRHTNYKDKHVGFSKSRKVGQTASIETQKESGEVSIGGKGAVGSISKSGQDGKVIKNLTGSKPHTWPEMNLDLKKKVGINLKSQVRFKIIKSVARPFGGTCLWRVYKNCGSGRPPDISEAHCAIYEQVLIHANSPGSDGESMLDGSPLNGDTFVPSSL
ncbi:hypothetical protein SESBI_11746 [Sesbania bispinosa]|nr:hypothetical protein SESBI_11746 [Sesbania bispinosa]